MSRFFIVALSFFLIFAVGTLFLQQAEGDMEPACALPVLEYTTGALDEVPENLYSDSVEWVVVDYLPVRSRKTPRGSYDGWVVLIRLVADGDEDLEDFTLHPQNLAQVKFNGKWMLQADFERLLCNTPPV